MAFSILQDCLPHLRPAAYLRVLRTVSPAASWLPTEPASRWLGGRSQWRGVGAGEVLGGAGGWARVKSGFILPILAGKFDTACWDF
jgi:hypothetical protein